jgi:hydrogenase maturation protease
LSKLVAHVVNEAVEPDDETTLHAAHLVIGASSGAFVSLIDPPAHLKAMADGCRNVGVWPVLAGEPPTADLLLCSPIILYDHPALAPESPGNLFDGTEIDEILTLRILTLTDAEREELRAGDERVRAILERTESLGSRERALMHGVVRRMACEGQPSATSLRPGDRVLLRPKRRADILDLALAGRAARVASIEQDFEGRVQVAVTVEDDPGSDLGLEGRPGHRFFFHLDEVQAIAAHGEPR